MIEAISRASLSLGDLRSSVASQVARTPADDFGSVLNSIASGAVGTIRAGEEAAAAGIIGTLPVQQVVEWTADWVRKGGVTLEKPTHFETRDGKY